MKPKWAQPICGERKCSICDNTDVYYSKLETWTTETVIHTGHVVELMEMGAKSWCKDCFENCGGKDYV